MKGMFLKKILVLNPFGIGDVLFTTPLLAALKRHLPDLRIGYLCNKRTQELVRSNPNVERVFVFEKDEYRELWKESKIGCVRKFLRFLNEIRDERFNAVFDLSLNSQFGFFLWLIGIPKRIGYNYKNRGRFLTDRIKLESYADKHMVEYYKSLAGYLGAKPDDDGLEVFLSNEDENWAAQFLRKNGIDEKSLIVGIVPGGGASWGKDAIYKQWPKEGFASVADSLVEKDDAKILIMGNSSDYGACESVADIMKHKPIMACGKMSLPRFAALLKKCKVVITNDGGPLHVATSVGTKTVSIFGPVDERVYGPYPNDGKHVVVKSDITCRPCYKNFKFQKCKNIECLRSLDAQKVIEAAEKLMKEKLP